MAPVNDIPKLIIAEVLVEHRTDPHPTSPPLQGQQLFGRSPQTLTILTTTRRSERAQRQA